ncbi:glycosyltransferase [Actinophytocola xanthii]|uniref:Glycosyl transferase n=1 Tax=Actinophytocola xanthii TaxID=1912961 RepID=A0A1Q8CMY6_9PSEU|nr:glycosyltransferase [Actinophytocola xanthii]OLF15721.1 glycosyl transferase [Actinophytocola xanthii]
MTDLSVLVVHNRYRSAQPSGEDNVVDQETALLREAGHRVELFERRSDDIATMSLLDKVGVPLRVPYNRAAREAMLARIHAVRPDVVHVHNTFPLMSPAVLDACTTAGIPVVATLHNYTQVCPTGTLYRDGGVCTDCVGRSPLPAVRHGCYRGSSAATVPVALSLLANRRRWWSSVSRFFCISAAQRDTLVAAGMPAELLAVKYNFVPDAGARRIGDGSYLLYLGRLAEEKGLRLLMAAWDEARPGVPLVIAGAGPLQDEVAAWAAERSDVRFVGLVDRAAGRALVADAVAVVAPSVWMETFGLVVVEAAAAGVPSVVAGHGALAELVADGVTGLTHRPGDPASLAEALRRVGPLSPILGAAARSRYEAEFTPRVGLRELVAGYRSVLSDEEVRRGAQAVR